MDNQPHFRLSSARSTRCRGAQGRRIFLAAGLLVLAVAAGCNSPKIQNRQPLVSGKLPYPGVIWVHPFAATAAEVPADSTLAKNFLVEDAAKTPEQIAEGREIGKAIAEDLAGRIRDLGVPAKIGYRGAQPAVNDIVLRGYLISIEEGDANKRVGIGFKAGASNLETAMEAFQVTQNGLRKLGSGTLASSSGKTPGVAVGAVMYAVTKSPAGLLVGGAMKVHGEESGKSTLQGRFDATTEAIAKLLEEKFREYGWIR